MLRRRPIFVRSEMAPLCHLQTCSHHGARRKQDHTPSPPNRCGAQNLLNCHLPVHRVQEPGFRFLAFAFAVLAFAAALDALVAIRLRSDALRLLARPRPPALAILCRSALMAAAISSLMSAFIGQMLHLAQQGRKNVHLILVSCSARWDNRRIKTPRASARTLNPRLTKGKQRRFPDGYGQGITPLFSRSIPQ